TWIFNTLTPLSELERMTQYKDKSKKHKTNINAGLLDYPVLMAADILLYKAEAVPVGQDQTQHLELARTLAKKFNAKYGDTFPEPATMLVQEGAKIMSLQDPKKKMSKSDHENTYIALEDSPETIEQKIMGSVTDAGKEVRYDLAKKPGISNLLTIYSQMSEESVPEAQKRFKGKTYAMFKKSLAELLILKLEPFRKKYLDLSRRDIYVKEILKQGRARAQSLASSTMEEVREKVGFLEL
ncbi:MAG: tryptophan--tRNA ligase, partial [Candidatus Wildermuthbacteria bacterium]|nr:tryptophan--tRNA ligase [Candidatus Wildermuthbacteria bacterium]